MYISCRVMYPLLLSHSNELEFSRQISVEVSNMGFQTGGPTDRHDESIGRFFQTLQMCLKGYKIHELLQQAMTTAMILIINIILRECLNKPGNSMFHRTIAYILAAVNCFEDRRTSIISHIWTCISLQYYRYQCIYEQLNLPPCKSAFSYIPCFSNQQTALLTLL